MNQVFLPARKRQLHEGARMIPFSTKPFEYPIDGLMWPDYQPEVRKPERKPFVFDLKEVVIEEETE
jgi:hypothetical protein